MKLILDLVYQIIRNKSVWKVCIVLVAYSPFGVLLIKAKELAMSRWISTSVLIISVLMLIYACVLLYRILYELTSVGQYEADISPLNFIWLTVKYQLIFGLIIFLPSFYIFSTTTLEKIKEANSLEYSSFIIFKLIAKFLHLIGLAVVVGSRGLDTFFVKLKLLFINKSTIQIMTVIIILCLLDEAKNLPIFLKYSNSLLYAFCSLIVRIGYLMFGVLLIKEWQKLYFRSESI